MRHQSPRDRKRDAIHWRSNSEYRTCYLFFDTSMRFVKLSLLQLLAKPAGIASLLALSAVFVPEAGLYAPPSLGTYGSGFLPARRLAKLASLSLRLVVLLHQRNIVPKENHALKAHCPLASGFRS